MAHILCATLFCPPSLAEYLWKGPSDHSTIIYQTNQSEFSYPCGPAALYLHYAARFTSLNCEQCWDIGSPLYRTFWKKSCSKLVQIFCQWCTFSAWTMAVENVLRRDRYCIASVQFWDAPIAPYVVWCIVKVCVAATPLDRIRTANADMVMTRWMRMPWF